MINQPLYGHRSQETAFVVNDYPYGFTLRCKIRYWIEYRPRFGFRFMSQTTNPKRPGEVWNKPKASTYAEHAACMYLDENGHVQWRGVGVYSTHEQRAAFVRDFPQADFVVLRPLCEHACKRFAGAPDEHEEKRGWLTLRDTFASAQAA
jgi:hypothetical protein